jgi:hypothetical protein
MMFDSTDRLILINEAILNLFEDQFGQRRYKTEEGPDVNTFNIDPTIDNKTGTTNTDLKGQRNAFNLINPNTRRAEYDNNYKGLAKGSVGHKALEHDQREYNLWNQRGLQAFDAKAKSQNYTPAWNVRGNERREQMRGYLNYVRSDPTRLQRFNAQNSQNTIMKKQY